MIYVGMKGLDSYWNRQILAVNKYQTRMSIKEARLLNIKYESKRVTFRYYKQFSQTYLTWTFIKVTLVKKTCNY